MEAKWSMMRGLKICLSTGLFSLICSGCQLEEDKRLEGWQPAFSGPIVNGRVTAAEALNQQKLTFKLSLDPSQLTLDQTELQVGKATAIQLGPLALPSLGAIADAIALPDSGLVLNLDNQLSAELCAGTTLRLTDADQGTLVLEQRLPTALEPGGSFRFEIPEAEQLADLSSMVLSFTPLRVRKLDSVVAANLNKEALNLSLQWRQRSFNVAFIHKPGAVGFSSQSSFPWHSDSLGSRSPLTGEFKLALKNRMPLMLKVQGYLHQQEQRIDSLFSQPVRIPSAKLNGNGRAIGPSDTTVPIKVDQELLRSLNRANRLMLIFKAVATGTDHQVQLRSADYVSFRLRGNFQKLDS